jgi:hypothetical protein
MGVTFMIITRIIGYSTKIAESLFILLSDSLRINLRDDEIITKVNYDLVYSISDHTGDDSFWLLFIYQIPGNLSV